MSFRLYENFKKIFLAHSLLSKPNLSPMLPSNSVSASQPDSHFKGRGGFLFGYGNDTQIFHKIEYDLTRPVLCYGDVVRFF